MRQPSRSPLGVSGTLVLAPLLLVAACKDGEESGNLGGGPGGAAVDPIPRSSAGTSGCDGADQDFAACGEIDLTAVLAALSPAVSSLRRIAGALSDDDLLYATAVHSASGDSTVLELDLTDPMAPVVTDLLPAGAVDAFVSGQLPGTAQGSLGELAVLDASTLVVVELATNTIVSVGRSTPASILPFAGMPSAAGGFLDSTPASALFDLGPESQLAPTADGRVFVADTANNAVRVVIGNPAFDPGSLVLTLAGGGPGMDGFADGALADALLDAPTGLALTCSDELVVTERGDGGEGHRVRRMTLFGFDPSLGALTGVVETCAGDGTSASSAGVGTAASVAEPAAPASSSGGELYWIDAASGTLRRQSEPCLAVGCPLAPGGDCSQPSQLCSPGTDDFTPGASFSTAVSGDGDLYVLESGTTLLRRFGP